MLKHALPQGFSLVELMIASTLSLLLLGAALHLHGLNAATFRLVRSEHLLQAELGRLLAFVRDEARRAGFRAGEGPPLYAPGGQSLVLDAAPGEAAGSCLLYAYDRNGDGRLGIGREGRFLPGSNRSNLEQFGIRLHRGRLQVRLGGKRHACDGGRWADWSAPELRILRFHLQRRQDPASGRTWLRITLEGAVDSNTLALETETWLPNE